MRTSMMEYIHAQPELLKKTYDNRNLYIEPFLQILKDGKIKKIYVVGSGTSYHVATLAKKYMETYCHIETSVIIPTVFEVYEKVNINHMYKREEILVLAISQTGTSYSTIQALQRAKKQNYQIVVFTQDVQSEIVKYADVILPMQCEKEYIPAETQGYTTALLALYLMSTTIGKQLGIIQEVEAFDIDNFINNIVSTIQKSCEYFEQHAYEFLMMQKSDIIGYGFNHTTALEGALKLAETTKRKVSGFEIEEFIHGNEMGYDLNSYAIIIASDEHEYARSKEVRTFLREITEHVFVITNQKMAAHKKDLALDFQCPTALSPLHYIIVFQIMAARMCEQLKINNTRYPHDHEMISHTKETQFRDFE